MFGRKAAIIIVFALVITLMMGAVYADSTTKAGPVFKDVKADAWYKEAVYRLTELGAVNGQPDGQFHPDDNITVEQFIKMTVITGGNKIEMGKQYWAQPYIDFARASGMTEASDFNNYTRPVTRGEMARLLVRALKGIIFPDDLSPYKKMIVDYDKLVPELQTYILKAYASGLMTGYPDMTFRHEQNATRAEAAAMILRLTDKSKRLMAKDPDNSNGRYENYIEPQDLIRRVIELEMLGNFKEAYKYLDKGFTGNGVFTVENYEKRVELHVSAACRFLFERFPGKNFPVRCKVIKRISDDEIVVAYGAFDQEIIDQFGNDNPYYAAAKTLKREGKLWYLDIGNTLTCNDYIFKYNEGA